MSDFFSYIQFINYSNLMRLILKQNTIVQTRHVPGSQPMGVDGDQQARGDPTPGPVAALSSHSPIPCPTMNGLSP